MTIRPTWPLAFFLLLVTRPSAQTLPDPHVRSTEPALIAARDLGVRVSPTLRALVDRLDASDVAVYLTFDHHPSPASAGHISLLTAVPGRRYLRISIDRRQSGCQLLALLGHELQHAVEIAEARSVVNDQTMMALYRRIGFRSSGGSAECFDSAGAILAGRSVEKEVLAGSRGYAAQEPLR